MTSWGKTSNLNFVIWCPKRIAIIRWLHSWITIPIPARYICDAVPKLKLRSFFDLRLISVSNWIVNAGIKNSNSNEKIVWNDTSIIFGTMLTPHLTSDLILLGSWSNLALALICEKSRFQRYIIYQFLKFKDFKEFKGRLRLEVTAFCPRKGGSKFGKGGKKFS